MLPIEYVHVDVFADKTLQGNGLAVVFCDRLFDATVMLDLAREFKQFETIFLSEYDGTSATARIFTMDGELPFAGHPVIGAAAALHDRYLSNESSMPIRFRLREKEVPVTSQKTQAGYYVHMAQGKPVFMGTVPDRDIPWLAAAHNIALDQMDAAYPIEIVSTGLPYVLIPVHGGLEFARITVRDLEARIAVYGASYTYLFDIDTLEARTWDNLGLVEDSATGSAAGPVCAYLVRHGHIREGQSVKIHQGRYANRPGVLHAVMENGEVFVSGNVVFFARGQFTLP